MEIRLYFLHVYALIELMDTAKTAAAKAAFALGFDDVRFAGLEQIADLQKSWASAHNASCVAVLFKAYEPCTAPPPGHMALSAYYTASHFAYHAARAFAAYLCARGGSALHTTALPAKKAAMLTGGFMGDNGFYHHTSLGSLVCIQTVITDAFAPDAPEPIDKSCLHCGACMDACPSGAVGDLEGCLRRHFGGLVPEPLRADVYQLLGCERCQTACPQNPQGTSAPISFSLDSLLDGSEINKLRDVAGAGMARKNRILSQAALYADNTDQKALADKLLNLSQTAPEPVRTHAQWAYEKLIGEKNHDQA